MGRCKPVYPTFFQKRVDVISKYPKNPFAVYAYLFPYIVLLIDK